MLRRINSRRNKKIKLMAIVLIILFSIFMLFSVIFSLSNMGNNKIVTGVKIGNIDVSNLSQEEAIDRLKKWQEDLIKSEITVVYKDMEENIKIEELNIDINIDKLVKEAILIGKSGNIIKDNYDILSALLFGKKIENEINVSSEKVDKKIENLNSKLPNALEESNYYVEDNHLIITKGKSGVEIEKEKFHNLLKEVIDNNFKKFTIPVKNASPQEINIEKIHQEIYKEMKNAYISENPVEVHPHINGIDFAISIEEAKKLLEEEKEEYSIPLVIHIPEITLEKLGKEAFPNKLGSFTTRYDASNRNRSTNLELASKKINGTIVLPGEIFSYNKIVGERTIEKGYKEAAVYSGGKVVEGIGGGICQLSSTLYNAVIYANLEITARNNHRFLTSYVTAGRDATVSWGTIDFCFKNTRNYPIKVESIVKNGVATVTIYGMKEEKEYEVIIENTITEVIPYTTNYIKDMAMEKGMQEIKQNGANGAKSETYKVLKYNGIIVSRTLLSKDTYSPLERIIKQGTNNTKETSSDIVEDIGTTNNKEQINELNPKLLDAIKELE